MTNFTEEENGILEAILRGTLYFYWPLSFAIILANITVAVAILKYRPLRQKSNYYLLSLAVTDLSIGTLAVPMQFFLKSGLLPASPVSCNIIYIIDNSLSNVSIYHVVTITVDRYISVQWPFRYACLINERRTKALIIVTWIVGTVMGTLQVSSGYFDLSSGSCHGSYQPYDIAYSLILLLTPIVSLLVVVSLLYGHIACIVRGQIKKLSKLTGVTGIGNIPVSGMKTIKTVGLVVGALILAWLPYHVLVAVEIAQGYSTFAIKAGYPPAIMLGWINSAVNPFIYAYSSKKFRTACRLILSCETNSVLPLSGAVVPPRSSMKY